VAINKFNKSLSKYLLRRYKTSLRGFNYKNLPTYVCSDENRVFTFPCDIDLMFRFIGERLVIARIGFETRRAGNGRDLLRFLSSQSELTGHKYIELESVSKMGRSFGYKYGFSDLGKGNLGISVFALKQNLEMYNT